MATACAVDPEYTQGLKAPAPNGTYTLVALKGPGVFLGATISKQGGSNNITFVALDIDGRSVANQSFAGAMNMGLTQQNPFGMVLLQSASAKTLTVGFPTPLAYKQTLTLSVTVNEANVVQIVGGVVHGSG
jgi:hypothetical protein